MMQSLKYGLLTTVGYIIILTVLFALTAWLDGVEISYYYGLITPFYIVLMATGGIVAFLAGFCFPHIFFRMVAEYTSEYPDVPEKYVIQICRGKLLKRYSYNLAVGCFLAGLLICLGKQPPIIVWYLISIGAFFGVAYLRYKQKYRNL
ncbi:MAG: hypothetical protein J6B28_00580 [Eubacterium sp.]|nr:hypothetical protein [Eubacterium sp.]